ncbi:MAG TPA: cupin domain-containing protein [Planctomycetota bacterium]|jgi:mannose-6-phosphate isomerase-like protein (cupin superfamily)|nr:cupin domain-containing protein [Planctomycetota bacterium]
MRSSLLLCALVIVGCSSQPPLRGRVLTTLPDAVDPLWTEAEMAKPIAVRRLRATAETSISLIRLAGAEQPHIHKDHDLVVVLLAGQARVHLGDHVVEVHPGDVMEIPRGTVHWAENTGATASEVYAVFSPPYDGHDNLPTSPAPSP